MYSQFLGIDPGLSGGLALITRRGKVQTLEMPDEDLEILEWLEKRIDIQTRVMIEWISPAIFAINKSSMSKLYGSFASLKMAVSALGLEYTEVRPQEWQPALQIKPRKKKGSKFIETPRDWKNRLLRKAQSLFPRTLITLKTADALLIAEHCRRTSNGSD